MADSIAKPCRACGKGGLELKPVRGPSGARQLFQISRILDALEEAREVIGEAAMCQLCGGNPCSRADDETGCIDPDNVCSHKARNFLAKHGEGSDGN